VSCFEFQKPCNALREADPEMSEGFMNGDTAWMRRHRWFAEACYRLFADHRAVSLDG
jgi:hypothetical protein